MALCRNQRPTPEAWVQGDDKLKSLSTDMYQIVSTYFSLNCIINLHLIQTLISQTLITDQKNPGAYRPLGQSLIDKNLRRNKIWNSIEVHVIYALFYIFCMSQEGVQNLKIYFSAEDDNVFEPYFIAQYLLAPVNTIVKNTLVPWILQSSGPSDANPKNNSYVKEISNSRAGKARVYFKYSLLVDLLHIVKTYGRNPNYDFDNDQRLFHIRNGNFSVRNHTDRTKQILLIDSFITIWLLTLPEKFQAWYARPF